jgi:hypothetical protein
MASSASINLTQMMAELLNQKIERAFCRTTLPGPRRADCSVNIDEELPPLLGARQGAASGSTPRPWRRLPDAPVFAAIACATTNPGFSSGTPEIFSSKPQRPPLLRELAFA